MLRQVHATSNCRGVNPPCGTTFRISSILRDGSVIRSSRSILTASALPRTLTTQQGSGPQVFHRFFFSSTGSTTRSTVLCGASALLDRKLRAVKNCGEAGLGVVIVPTLVKGVNTGSVGDIVRLALRLAPAVRGVHFQPISYFGRFPKQRDDEGRFTLPELMRSLEEQTEGLLKAADFSPPGCEHAHCSFHASYLHSTGGDLRPLITAQGDSCCSADPDAGGVGRTVETVSRRWRLPFEAPFLGAPRRAEEAPCCCGTTPKPTRVEDALDLDAFLEEAAARSFTISAMAFQDADNLDLERLKGCCISVASADGRLVPFCAYNLTSREGRRLYLRRNG